MKRQEKIDRESTISHPPYFEEIIAEQKVKRIVFLINNIVSSQSVMTQKDA